MDQCYKKEIGKTEPSGRKWLKYVSPHQLDLVHYKI